MGIQFRKTANRKQDLLRYLLAGVLFLVMVTIYLNQSDPPLDSLTAGYQGFVLKGTHNQHMLSEEGVTLLKTWIDTRTRSAFNPATILQPHRNSENPLDTYELAIGMRPIDEDTGFREYGYYQKGRFVLYSQGLHSRPWSHFQLPE